MELQPKAISYLRFNAKQYQYKPSQETQIHNKKYFEMYYKTNPDICFVQLFETVFSDRYLYEHAKFRQLMEESKKGFVNIDTILEQQLMTKFLQEMGDEKPKHKDVIQLIKRLSSKLICNRYQVRRKYPFVNKLKLSKPVYIEEYPQNDGNEELETLLQSTSNIYKIKYNHYENWATVFAEEGDKIKKLNGHFWSINTYFRVMGYEKAKLILENSFISSGYELKKFYQKSIFNRNSQQKERNNQYHTEDSDVYFDEHNRNYNSEPSDDEMNDEEEYRAQQRYLGNRRRDINSFKSDNQFAFKENEKEQYLQPNFIFNVTLLTNNNQSINTQFISKSKLNEERQKQIQEILLQSYQQNTLPISSKNKIKQHHMQLQ